MYQISFAPRSNRESWTFVGAIMDANTNELLDLSDLSFEFAIRDRDGCQRLLASTDNEKFVVIGTGLFQWSFTKDEMRCLYPGTYETGFLMWQTADPEQASQLSVGPLPIVDGNTP
ncbi:hypothetical protein JQ633_01095 [Bradyrhizobium tropiciagri]|uniref:hypothetical protein n=1 Tax=Bradyrhizobium tropiciagri TaxID=312253 RepID=UPI001BAD27C5|nr:hypothetical protein [Bradyrhizobium tropiciagri]MBR0868937.1 hypothetical protein [Bradyrhizobium tropiciagri]